MTPRPRSKAPFRVTVRPIALAQHELEVEMTIPADLAVRGPVLCLPAWTPGSYMLRDHARFLDRVRLGEHTVPKVDTHRWRLPPSRTAAVLRYRLFCNDLTVRTNHADATHAHVVGAATFLYAEGEEARPYEVTFEGFPQDWRIATSLPSIRGGFRAPDYDTLVDSPFELGTFRRHVWNHAEVDFELAITGEHPASEARILEGTRRIVEACGRLFGGFPFRRYVFLLTFSPGSRGGLEHRDSTLLLHDPCRMDTPAGCQELFLLIAHEFFHAWNARRLRAPELARPDLRREAPTRLLWFFEGVTSFIQFGLCLRSGTVPLAACLRRLGDLWADSTTRAGRLEQSLEEASLDAWIRHYKPTEFTTNSGVSYYDKGACVAWMMDARIRLATKGAKGLEELVRLLWTRHGDAPVDDAMIRDAYQTLACEDPEPFWEAFIRGTAELDARPVQQAYGVLLEPRAPWEALGTEEAADPQFLDRARTWTGLVFGRGDAPTVSNVVPGSPAFGAGISYGHEILAVNGWRTSTAAEAQRRLRDAAPGQELEILACQRGRVVVHRLTTVENPARAIRVRLARPSPVQRRAFAAWTGEPFPDHNAARSGSQA